MAAAEERTSYFSMPGSFHSEGVHPGLIRPPASPAATANSPISASAILTPASLSTPSALPRPKFKRRRPTGASSTPNNASSSTKDASRANHDSLLSSEWSAPAGVSNTDASGTARSYVLAGNLDTPGAVVGAHGTNALEPQADQGLMGESMFSDSDYRTVLGTKRRRDEIEIDHTARPSLYTLPSSPSQKAPGWGSLAFSTLGGVVGKVWDFCWGGTFKGFHAGAGRGYDAPHDGGSDDVAESPIYDLPGGWNQDEDKLDDEVAYPALEEKGLGTSENYNSGISYSRRSTPTRQPAKRRQTDKTDDLGRNWVVISSNETSRASPGPVRPPMPRAVSSSRPRAVGSTPSGRRVTSSTMNRNTGSLTPASRLNVRRVSSRGGRYSASNGWEKPQTTSTASFASPRSSPARGTHEPSLRDSYGASTPSRRRTAAPTKPTVGTNPEPSRPGHRRTNSNASAAATRSPHGSDPPALRRQPSKDILGTKVRGGEKDIEKQSPRLTEEARRLAAKRRMEERDADIKMAAFNRRLQDMIRQGKEALGTTVAVEMDGPGQRGWEDDE